MKLLWCPVCVVIDSKGSFPEWSSSHPVLFLLVSLSLLRHALYLWTLIHELPILWFNRYFLVSHRVFEWILIWWNFSLTIVCDIGPRILSIISKFIPFLIVAVDVASILIAKILRRLVHLLVVLYCEDICLWHWHFKFVNSSIHHYQIRDLFCVETITESIVDFLLILVTQAAFIYRL